jgi:hypothetical protein
MHIHSEEEEIDDFKRMMGEQALVIKAFKKEAARRAR